MKHYDFLVVGAGLYGAVFAHEAVQAGASVLVVERRPHIAGNLYTYEQAGIQVHAYGAHIFHTSDRAVWAYIGQFAEFNRYTNSPVADYRGEIYNLPFNMNTFSRMFGVKTPDEARTVIRREVEAAGIGTPRNLEEQAISMVGRTIYEKLIRGYTAKQWGCPCTELPPSIIKRLPVRFVYDNNYFNDLYQGIPVGGYTGIIERMLANTEVRTSCDFLAERETLTACADRTVYTGTIDGYFGYRFGTLEYRSLHFETEMLDTDNYQGCAVVNYTSEDVPYTRIIEHKHFEFGCQSSTVNPHTVITREYPVTWKPGDEPYYPVNNDRNGVLYARYRALADTEPRVIFGGRLGLYRYLDMHQVIAEALAAAKQAITVRK